MYLPQKIKNCFGYRAEDKKYIRIYIDYLKEYYFYAIEAFVCSITVILMSLPLPLASIFIIDEVIKNKRPQLLLNIILFLFAFLILKAILSSLERYILTQYHLKVSADIKYDLHNKTLKHPISYFNQNSTGYIVSRIENDINRIGGLSISSLLESIQSILLILFSTLILFSIDWHLAMLSYFVIPIMVTSNIYFSKKTEKEYEIYSETSSRVYEKAYENFSAIKTIKLFLREDFAFKNYLNLAKKEFKRAINIEKIEVIANFCQSLINILGPVIILGYGSYQVILNNMSLGQFFAFNTLLVNVYNPIMKLLRIQINIKSSMVYLRRIGKLWDNKVSHEYLTPSQAHIPTNTCKSEIVIRNLSFRYREDSNNVLSNLSFSINKGDKIAIMGKSGCGKSTLLQILAGLYTKYEGQILINNCELKECNILEFRKQIGFITQEAYILRGTIRDNILFGNKSNITDEDIMHACYISALDHDLVKAKGDLLKEINQNTLSIGQKQRITIARALVKNTEYLFFDEPTSALDDNTWKKLLSRILKHNPNHTYLVVTHDIRLAKTMDYIINLDSVKSPLKSDFTIKNSNISEVKYATL